MKPCCNNYINGNALEGIGLVNSQTLPKYQSVYDIWAWYGVELWCKFEIIKWMQLYYYSAHQQLLVKYSDHFLRAQNKGKMDEKSHQADQAYKILEATKLLYLLVLWSE